MPSPSDISAIETQYQTQLSLLWQPLGASPIMAYHAQRQVKTASIIKLPILTYTALQVEQGHLTWEHRLDLPSNPVGGMGILKLMDKGLQPTIRDVATLMTVISDNTATNMLIDVLGIDNINQHIQAVGMTHTHLNRKVFAPNTPACLPWGLGVTTAYDVVHLLTLIASGRLGNAATNQWLRQTLAAQQDRVGIPRALPVGWHYAGKTGSDEDLKNDCGILTTPQGDVVVVACFAQELADAPHTADHPGLQAIIATTRTIIGS
jgi:beta-lactamase class A